MKTFLLLVCAVSTIIVVYQFGSVPKEYQLYPEKSAAHVMLYNSQGDTDERMSDMAFKLHTSLGVCAESNKGGVHAMTDGTLWVCTATGWQPPCTGN